MLAFRRTACAPRSSSAGTSCRTASSLRSPAAQLRPRTLARIISVRAGGEGSTGDNEAGGDAGASEADKRSGAASSSASSGDTYRLPALGAEADWRQFRAKLVAQERGTETQQWAHTVPKPEKGSLLLAHPLMFSSSQQYFYQAIILLLNHDETGSFGVILNRPSQYTLGQLSLTKNLSEFDSCRLFVGGDVGDGTLQMVHTRPGLQGSVEVVNGIFMGGIEAARQAVAAGQAKPEDFRWFARYSGWGPGQLESECRSGVWFTVAGSPDLVLKQPSTSNGRDLWHHVLQLMGGEHKVLSEKILDVEASGRKGGAGESE